MKSSINFPEIETFKIPATNFSVLGKNKTKNQYTSKRIDLSLHFINKYPEEIKLISLVLSFLEG